MRPTPWHSCETQKRQADAAMLVSIEPARAGVDLHTFECAVCNHVLETLAAYDDPMKSKGLERWLLGDLHPPT